MPQSYREVSFGFVRLSTSFHRADPIREDQDDQKAKIVAVRLQDGEFISSLSLYLLNTARTQPILLFKE